MSEEKRLEKALRKGQMLPNSGRGCAPQAQFQELRELIKTARAFLGGEVHFSYVCCAVRPFCDAAHLFSAGTRIREMADEWEEMATRVWPEMMQIDNQITEEEFRRWVQLQLG
jgi:hypothetical protein